MTQSKVVTISRKFSKYGLIMSAFVLPGVLFIMTIITTAVREQPESLFSGAISILRAGGTLIWFLFELLILVLFLDAKQKNLRVSFIRASLYFSVFIWMSTELLGVFVFLNLSGIVYCHIVYDIVVLLLFYRRSKREYQACSRIRLVGSRGLLFFSGNCSETEVPKQLYWFIAVILGITFYIAFVFPPNNWDSMTYHLPRVEHWLQNNTLKHYFSSINRQLLSAPFAEMTILHGRAVSGDNLLMNLTQWLSFAGCAIGISLITGHLGATKKIQTVASLFFLTLPMGILQSTSTQTDLVEAFFIIGMAERFLSWKKTGGLRNSVDFGIALGLCILTKGTAYPIAFPFVCCFAAISLKHFKSRILFAFAAALICLTLNMPHMIRNQISFGNPVGAHDGTVSDFTPKQFVLSSFFNIYSNIPFPLPRISSKINEILRSQGADIFPYGPGQIVGTKSWLKTFAGQIHFDEDSVKNGAHLLFIIVSFIVILRKKQKPCYFCLALSSWLIFFYFIPWQPWITRLQLPLFALSSPIAAFAFAEMQKRFARYVRIYFIFLCCFSVLPLFLNTRRPLLYVPKLTEKAKLIWNASRDELLFNARSSVYMKNYIEACDIIANERIGKIGIIIGGDSFEYPLWYYLSRNMADTPKIAHQNSADIDKDVDILFILERKDIPFTNIGQHLSEYPYVLKRDPEGWTILYAPSDT
jgi:hypothetical protein